VTAFVHIPEGIWPAVGTADMSERSDLELVQRTVAGESEAFGELVRRHERVVYNLAYRFMRNTAQAEDAAQESFIKAYRLLRSFRGDCRFSSWLYRVTCNVCLTELNRAKRRGEVERTAEHQGQTATGDTASAEMAEKSDSAALIRRCVTQLPERYAAIVTLYYLQELSYEEIAEIMSIPMGTLKTWMHRARTQLKVFVEKEMAGHGSSS
jgi:RNA polymerase sigma-70 factor, ECF subfamily